MWPARSAMAASSSCSSSVLASPPPTLGASPSTYEYTQYNLNRLYCNAAVWEMANGRAVVAVTPVQMGNYGVVMQARHRHARQLPWGQACGHVEHCIHMLYQL